MTPEDRREPAEGLAQIVDFVYGDDWRLVPYEAAKERWGAEELNRARPFPCRVVPMLTDTEMERLGYHRPRKDPWWKRALNRVRRILESEDE